MPGGQLPVLEIDGFQLGQPMAIARFLANKYNLAGSTDFERAQGDMIVESTHDFLNGRGIIGTFCAKKVF